jgi:hypothetical protein
VVVSLLQGVYETLKRRVKCTECSFSVDCGGDVIGADEKRNTVMESHERKYKHVVMCIFCDSEEQETS